MEFTRKQIDQLTDRVIGGAIEVHRQLGPGLLESTYESCLCWELQSAGIEFARQLELPIRYKGNCVQAGYRLDLLIENVLIVELKSIDRIEPIHKAQLLTYLRLSGLQVGLLINFNTPLLKDGVVRIVNNLPEDASAPVATLR